MNRLKSWKAQGSYRSYNTGKPMLLVLDKDTGATILEPLIKKTMRTLTEIRDEKLKKEAKELARQFLSRGMSMRDLGDFGDIIKAEADYQVENNTIGGLSNGRIV